MRVQVRLPKIHLNDYGFREHCPYEGCSGDTFKPHGQKGETLYLCTLLLGSQPCGVSTMVVVITRPINSR